MSSVLLQCVFLFVGLLVQKKRFHYRDVCVSMRILPQENVRHIWITFRIKFLRIYMLVGPETSVTLYWENAFTPH